MLMLISILMLIDTTICTPLLPALLPGAAATATGLAGATAVPPVYCDWKCVCYCHCYGYGYCCCCYCCCCCHDFKATATATATAITIAVAAVTSTAGTPVKASAPATAPTPRDAAKVLPLIWRLLVLQQQQLTCKLEPQHSVHTIKA